MKRYQHKFLVCLSITAVFFVFSICAFGEMSTGNQFFNPENSKTISMDFREAPLNDVLKIFSQQSGLNFIASSNIADKQITLFLDKVPVEEALEKILSANNLTYEIQADSNIFVVKSVAQPDDELLTRVYYLRYATVLSSRLNKTVKIKADEDQSSTLGGGSSASTSAASNDDTADEKSGIVAAVKTALSKKGAIVEDPRTNSLTVTDIPNQFPIIEQTIARLDVPVPQILIEVEMLDISKQTADQLGVKIGSTPLTFTGAERNHYYPWNQNQLLDKGLVENPAYRVGTISAAGLSAALQFLRTKSDTKNLARPRILTLNNQTAQIKISTNEAIGLGTTTQSSQSTATTTSQAERVETGVFLTVTPQANLLTKEITMAIAPKVIQARTGGTFEGKTFKDPEERGSRSILRVNDSDTIMLGGLLRTDYSNTQTKVPLFGDIPIVGAAFRHKDSSDTERELVIFITPHIAENNDSNLALKTPEKVVREQDLPPERLKAIDKALAAAEKRR